MLRAPGDFVKVYIYGLMQCYHPAERMSLAAMAKDLGMEEDAVFRAFQYWERQGAVRRVGDNPPAYAYKNLKQAQLTASTDPSQDLYRYREFNEEPVSYTHLPWPSRRGGRPRARSACLPC